MTPQEDNFDDLPKDFCDLAAEEYDDDEQIKEILKQLQQSGVQPATLGDFHFSLITQAKVQNHGLTVNDVMHVIADGNFDRSSTTGSQSIHGRCAKGNVVVIVNPDVKRRAAFEVITAYIPE